MEHLPPISFIDRDYPLSLEDPGYTASRKAMGHTRQFAQRIHLAAMTPRPDLSSTRFCLANPGKEYLVYQPNAGEPFTIDLAPGRYDLERFNPETGAQLARNQLTAPGGKQPIPAAPTEQVLYLKIIP